jgi:polyphenol oxidase
MPSTLEIITSDTLAPRHGFFTRKGGASSGVFSGLNCGTGSSDQTEAVAINRARVAEAMGVGPEAVTATPGVLLSVLTADCQPVLFADAKAGVIGAAHAGWRGAVDGVLEATLDAMETLGAKRADISAVIGPTISQAAYEVGPEFLDRFRAEDAASIRFFAAGTGDRMLFDLPGYGLQRLRAAGVGTAEWTGHCTYRDPARFYSFRRTTHAGEADYGRLIATIRL